MCLNFEITVAQIYSTCCLFFQFEPETSQCVVKPPARSMIFTQLACELLFKHGPSCTSLGMFMSEWRNYFGVPLTVSEVGVESLEVLASLPDVSLFIKVSFVVVLYMLSVLR